MAVVVAEVVADTDDIVIEGETVAAMDSGIARTVAVADTCRVGDDTALETGSGRMDKAAEIGVFGSADSDPLFFLHL